MTAKKKVIYDSPCGYLPLNVVAYSIYGNQIIFVGLHSCREGRVGSTINNEEHIVCAIAEAEKIEPREYLFYDLQTHLQYTYYQPGQFALSELQLEWSEDMVPVCVNWIDGKASDEVLNDFSEFIGRKYPSKLLE